MTDLVLDPMKLIPDPDHAYGSWIGGQEYTVGRYVEVTNPALGEPLARVQLGGTEVAEMAVVAARKAFATWSGLSYDDRGRYLIRFNRLLERFQDAIATLIALEQGKPITEALAVELFSSADTCRYLARHAAEDLAPQRHTYQNPLMAGKRGEVRYEPVGPVLIVTPWNLPFLIPATEVAQALAAGNTIVLRPSPVAPFSALALQRLLERAGLPPGVVNTTLVTDETMYCLARNRQIRRISFFGGEGSGRRMMTAAAEALTPITLQMDGKDAAIVCADCDLERTALGVAWWGLANAGQVSAGIQRVYVERPIARAFLERLARIMMSLRMGDPLDPQTDIGPLTLSEQRDVVIGHVADAVARGAKLLVGGEVPRGPGWFYPPTLLAGVDHSMPIMRQDTYGPVIPVMVVDSVDEAVALANDSEYGMAASVWTENPVRARLIARRLRVGSVGINDHGTGYGEPQATFGGEGKSGIGRTHGRHGLIAMSRIKHVSEEYHARRPPWWFPYNNELRDYLKSAFGAVYRPGFGPKFDRVRHILSLKRFRRAVRIGSFLKRWRQIFD